PRAQASPLLLHPGRPSPAQAGGAARVIPDARCPGRAAWRLRLPDPRRAARAARDRRHPAGPRGRRRRPGGEGPRHAPRAGAARARSAGAGGRAPPRRRRQQRGPRLGRPLLLRPLLRSILPPAAGSGRARVSGPAERATDRRVLLAFQGLALGLPLLAPEVPWLLGPVCLAALGLLAVAAYERGQRSGSPHAPGVAWLAAFVLLALATTVPLPPQALELLAPSTAELYGRALPGWPEAGGWSAWRSLAVDPYGVCV